MECDNESVGSMESAPIQKEADNDQILQAGEHCAGKFNSSDDGWQQQWTSRSSKSAKDEGSTAWSFWTTLQQA